MSRVTGQRRLTLAGVTENRTLVAIPAWNEQGSIADVIAKVRQHRPDADVLVVDDGSTDATALFAAEAGAVVVSLPFNVGVGGAMRTAFLYAKRHGYAAMVQVDADGQHDPADLDRVLDGLAEADVVVGHAVPPGRLCTFVGGPRRWAMVLLSKTFEPDEPRNHSPTPRRASALRGRGPSSCLRWTYPADYLGDTVGSLAIAIRRGLVIHETPVTMYFRQTGRPSKNAVWSALYLGRATLAIIATSLKGRSVPKGDLS